MNHQRGGITPKRKAMKSGADYSVVFEKGPELPRCRWKKPSLSTTTTGGRLHHLHQAAGGDIEETLERKRENRGVSPYVAGKGWPNALAKTGSNDRKGHRGKKKQQRSHEK